MNKKLEFGGRALRDKQLDLKLKLPRCLFRLQRSSGDHIDVSFWQTTSNLTKSNFAMHCYQFNGELRIPAAESFSASRNDLGTKGCGAPRLSATFARGCGVWKMSFKSQPKLHATHRLVPRAPHITPKEIPTFYSRGLANRIATNCNSSLTGKQHCHKLQ